MYDYVKLWVREKEQIDKILDNPLLSFKQLFSIDTGEVISYPITCTWNVFTLKLKSPTWLQITGSLHKYWNNGTNENDFTFSDVNQTIEKFCRQLDLSPSLATIHNLEYGINIRPSINASTIIQQVICFKNTPPSKPYEGNKNHFPFIEFSIDAYYFKIYDKGKQYNTDNILRIEVKAMTANKIKFAGAVTLEDLTKVEVMQLLGMELDHFCSFIIFNDPSINPNELKRKDKDIYNRLKYCEEWTQYDGHKTTTQKRYEARFKDVVDQYGVRHIYSHLKLLVKEKVGYLSKPSKWPISLSIYTKEVDQKRYCKSCNKPLNPSQKKESLYCSAKYVGLEAAHKCRNSNSNAINNLKRKIEKIESKGVLFDITPYVIKQKVKAV
ncbi:hypothetical protein [Segetibacter aerophilus]|uniref:Uncharacterized protein n=1 Tax=Segetibacter aerophilus TaxID=670293 RepID=A0A512BBY7_9BACT|nr:hypothetical protein [Segetibacter aerophilus]GEO09491.1 hypothetical protein SAE01_19870 [Segetibacter aerophilus]